MVFRMTKRSNVKAVYIEVPVHEYQIFKTFALMNDISMQKLIRSATMYWIKESKNRRDFLKTLSS